ncbi:hypothetical protein HK104_003518 [Borealophlyctis nickersoniae]|nr:hypothetical protein HK104_003518 [Borealophlyctis nickersoniae]
MPIPRLYFTLATARLTYFGPVFRSLPRSHLAPPSFALIGGCRSFALTPVHFEKPKQPKDGSALPLPPPRKWKKFTPEEDERIKELRGLGWTWKAVGKALGRNPGSCEIRAQYVEQQGAEKRTWTESDDFTILDAKKRGMSFSEIGKMLHRHKYQVAARWRFLDAPNRKWNRRDDSIVISRVQKALENCQQPDWEAIASELKRSVDKVRNRYVDILDPYLKHGRFSQRESDYVLHEVEKSHQMGRKPHWAAIGRSLNRSGTSICRHYTNLLRKAATEDQGSVSSTATEEGDELAATGDRSGEETEPKEIRSDRLIYFGVAIVATALTGLMYNALQ